MSDGAYTKEGTTVTLTERIASIESYRRTRDNVIRLDAPRERRTTPRWIEWTRENQTNPNAGKSYDNRWGGDAA